MSSATSAPAATSGWSRCRPIVCSTHAIGTGGVLGRDRPGPVDRPAGDRSGWRVARQRSGRPEHHGHRADRRQLPDRVADRRRSMPLASSVNMVPGQTVPNMVLAQVGAGGKVSIYNNSGSTHVVVDVFGCFAAGAPAKFVTMSPVTRARHPRGAPARRRRRSVRRRAAVADRRAHGHSGIGRHRRDAQRHRGPADRRHVRDRLSLGQRAPAGIEPERRRRARGAQHGARPAGRRRLGDDVQQQRRHRPGRRRHGLLRRPEPGARAGRWALAVAGAPVHRCRRGRCLQRWHRCSILHVRAALVGAQLSALLADHADRAGEMPRSRRHGRGGPRSTRHRVGVARRRPERGLGRGTRLGAAPRRDVDPPASPPSAPALLARRRRGLSPCRSRSRTSRAAR